MANIAIIGLGFMGQTHFRNYGLIKNANVVALCDIDSKRASGDFSGTWGNVETTSAAATAGNTVAIQSYRDVLKRADVDVVDVCVPTPMHAEITSAALEAGKHVLCEKPLTGTLTGARQLAATANRSHGSFMPAMCIRFWPAWAWAKEAVESGKYGAVRSATFTRLGGPPPGWYQDGKQSGGAILDLHIHDTDFVNYLFGQPEAVASRGYSKISDQIDHLTTQYLFEDGPVVVAEGGWTMQPAFGFRMRYTINFENATADYDLGREKQLILATEGASTSVQTATTDGWFEELKYFVECVDAGRRPTTVTADDAVRAIEVIEAERDSIRTGKSVEVPRM